MEPKEVVKVILESNLYENYEVLEHDKYFETKNPLKRFVRKFLRDGSWCDFSPTGTTKVYLKETDEKDKKLGNTFVAAHEASHALNYHENFTQFRMLRFFQNTYLTFYIAAVLLFVAFILKELKWYEVSLAEHRYWVYFLLIVVGYVFGHLHKYDEKRTDQRAYEELQKYIYTNEEDVEKAGQMLKKRYKERISSILFFKVAFPVMLVIVDAAVLYVY